MRTKLGLGRLVNPPRVSVIVPAYKDDARLALCLEALGRNSWAGGVEIIVVDNCAEFTLTEFAKDWPDVVFLHEPSPGSYSARNKGLGAATGEIIAFTDADCRPHPDWLESAAAFLVANPDIGMVGGKVNIVVDHGQTPTLAELFEVVLAFPQDTYIERNHFAATANMVTRRAVIERVGPFNAALKSGGDAEFGGRVHAGGVRQAYLASAQVDHPARGTAQELFRKVRRTVGGDRDRNPGWAHCLKTAAKCLPPPRRRVLSILRHSKPHVSAVDKVRLLALATALQWTVGYERVRLQITNAASARA